VRRNPKQVWFPGFNFLVAAVLLVVVCTGKNGGKRGGKRCKCRADRESFKLGKGRERDEITRVLADRTAMAAAAAAAAAAFQLHQEGRTCVCVCRSLFDRRGHGEKA
jgi:hypothetical protein